MHTTLALLCVAALASVCSSGPIRESTGIIDIARTTLIHINKVKENWPVASKTALVISPPAPTIEGLATISDALALLDSQLESLSSQSLRQIQADVSSLLGSVRYHSKAMHCPNDDQQARSGERRAAEEDSFPATQQYQRLLMLQHYLDHLVHNENKLNVC